MTTLALEFSSSRRSVGVRHNDKVFEVVHEGSQHTPIFGMIGPVLTQAGIERDQIERIAVGLGPGSYTGVRLAISVAQGWQLARGVKTVGVSSLENLRAVAVHQGLQGRMSFAVYAQRNEFAIQTMDSGRWISDCRLFGAEEVLRAITAGERFFGPELPAMLSGFGAPLFPTAEMALSLADLAEPVPAESLAPIYLREATFVKAPRPRVTNAG